MKILKYLYCTIIFLLFALQSYAQPEEPIPTDQAFQLSAVSQDSQTIVFSWRIAPGYYLYADRFHFILTNPKDAHFGQPILPRGQTKYEGKLDNYLVYQGPLNIAVPTISQTSLTNVVAQVTYQGCSAKGYCYPPVTKLVALDLSKIKQPAIIRDAETAFNLNGLTKQDQITNILTSRGFLPIILGFIGFGLLLTFTPCVLPMIPILSSIILGQVQMPAGKAFRLSLVYVLSMSITYAIAGVLVGYLGGTLQATLQKPWVIILFSTIFVLMAISLFGFYNLQLPQHFESFLAKISRHQHKSHYIGVAIMGCVGTLILSPCVTPPMIGVLSYIGQTGNALLGGIALFSMGIGMGIPLLLIVTSGAKWLPKTGHWMVVIKNILGVMLLGVAVWMLSRILPGVIAMLLWAALLIIPAIYMGALSFSRSSKTAWQKLWQGLGILMLAYGVTLIIGATKGNSNPLLPLANRENTSTSRLNMQMIRSTAELDEALATAKADYRPVLVDYYADWCVSCHIIDRYTFINPQVQTALQSFVLLRVDITTNDATAKALMSKFGVVAPPTILLFSEDALQPKLRLVGEVKAKELLQALEQVAP